MPHVLFEELVDDGQGILVGRGVEIQGAAKEMLRGIGEEELIGRGSIAADIEKDAADPVGGLDDGLIDGARLNRVFEGHLEGIVAQFFELVRSYSLIADIDTAVETGEIDIDPVRILGYGIEEAAVPDDIGIHGIFEGVRETRLVKGLVFMFGKIDPEVPPSFGCVNAVAGKKEKTYYRKTKIGHQSFNF